VLSLGAALEAVAGDVVSQTVIGGAGGWDYLAIDSARHHLFITRHDRVQVFDTDAMELIAEISGTDGVHGVALAPERNIGFTSNAGSSSVTVFDLASLKKLAQIGDVGGGPDAIVYDRRTSRVFTFNSVSRDATVIDVDTAAIVAKVPLRGKPEFAVTDQRGSIFVNLENRDAIARIDAATLEVIAEWPLPGCKGPAGMAIDVERRRLFVSCSNRTLVVVDATSGALVARLPIGAGSDAVAFDGQQSLVLSSNRDGTLSLIRQDADRYSVLPAIATRWGARTLALDSPTQRAFLVTSDFEPLSTPASGSSLQRRTTVPGTFSVLSVYLGGSGEPAAKR
jgi:DNA-binding beta-propeller fold protein YncE